MVFKNYYKILGLETSRVSIDEIKLAYRAAAKKYHPDLNVGDNLAEEKIKDINEAYKILSIPSSKRKYDRVWNSHFGKGQKAFTNKEKKETIVNMFLGNVNDNKSQKNPKKTQIRGENINTQIDTSIYEAFNGVEKQISLKTPEGEIKTYTFTIPKGIKNGEKIRLIGQGKNGKNGGKNGDLYIKINIKNDKKFKLKGHDIYTDLLLTPWEAALGTRANVDAIDEETKIYIPQGIQSGEKIKIPGKGYKIDNNTRGDLIAEVKIVVPRNLTEKEYKMFEEFSKISKFNPRAK